MNESSKNNQCKYVNTVTNTLKHDLIEDIDPEVILLAKSDEFKELFNMVTSNTNSDKNWTTERCAKCNECKVCKSTTDTKSTTQQAEQDFIRSCVHFENSEGRFYAKLPWKISPTLLQGNRKIAVKSHNQAKIKAHKQKENPDLAKEAFQQMIQRGTCIQVSKLPLGNGESDGLQDHLTANKNIHYTVNQLVFKPSSTTTKCRIMMDGSRTTTMNRMTLNRCLMGGPPDYNLVKSLAFWRMKSFAISTDISKFFNKICLYPEDRKHLSMIFTESFALEDSPDWFVLLVHSFGYTSTSGVAKEAVMKIAETANIHELYEVVKTLKLGYVDDLNPSVDTKEEMVTLKHDLDKIMTEHSMD